LSPRIVGNSQANKHRKQGKEAKATIIIRNFVKVKARTHCSQLVAIVALISLKLVTFFSSKQHARASSRQKESSYRVTNYSWMQRGKNLAFHISDLVFLAFHISLLHLWSNALLIIRKPTSQASFGKIKAKDSET